MRSFKALAMAALMLAPTAAKAGAHAADTGALDATIERLMAKQHVPGLALALIEDGRVSYKKTYGYRKLEGQLPLEGDTVMYGASLTKFLFATWVMTLVEDGRIDLDTPIGKLLPKPLPDYERFADLKDDPRWQQFTLRMLLGHTTGLPNFRFFLPDGSFDRDAKLRFFYNPGERYGYSGEGYYIAQLVVEEALGVKTGPELQKRIFDPLGMKRTSLVWRADFAPNFADGYTVEGENRGHNKQSNVRAAGSMDTTIDDFSAFVAAYMRGDIVDAGTRAKQLAPGLAITSLHKFPTTDPATNPKNADSGLSSVIGGVVFTGPQGAGFLKAGHNEKTDNMLVCLTDAGRCVLILSNTASGAHYIPDIVEAALGPTGMPWAWEYNTDAE